MTDDRFISRTPLDEGRSQDGSSPSPSTHDGYSSTPDPHPGLSRSSGRPKGRSTALSNQGLASVNRSSNQPSNEEVDTESTEFSEPERPNKYHGPPATWRSWTATERAQISSLIQERNRDLSLHLYAAYHLKRRLYDPRIIERARHYHGRHRWGLKLKNANEGYVAGRTWTAWPLKPGIVPREGEQWTPHPGVLEDSDCEETGAVQRERPSQWLEDVLMGIALKGAKEAFWESGLGREKGSLPATTAQDNRSEARMGDSPLNDGLQHQDFMEHAFTNAPTGDAPPQDYHPEILADDEKAAQLLHPPIRHALKQLDALLRALHIAREAYSVLTPHDKEKLEKRKKKARLARQGPTVKRPRGRPPKIHIKIASPTSSSGDDDEPHEDQRRDVGAKAKARPRKYRKVEKSQDSTSTQRQPSNSRPSASTTPDDSDEGRREEDTRATRSTTSAYWRANREAHITFKEKKQAQLNLRDWSDVLGTASIVGWDGELVQRAAARCSQLFGEEMEFRHMIEGERAVGSTGGEDRVSGVAEVVGKATTGVYEGSMVGGVTNDGFLEVVRRRAGWREADRGVRKDGRWEGKRSADGVGKERSAENSQGGGEDDSDEDGEDTIGDTSEDSSEDGSEDSGKDNSGEGSSEDSSDSTEDDSDTSSGS
ncbi:MAG: hypothetical protein M1824_001383 [Vezdaea acicularis]|nr:MAG: hypothetical protein M1824_001383 [Vezdaea acicularis]